MTNNNDQNGPDSNKVETLVSTLRKYPDGIWLRKLSRESSVPLSTVHYYIEEVIDSIVESKGARDGDGRYFGIRLIKLKDGIQDQLNSGKPIDYLLKARNILTDN